MKQWSQCIEEVLEMKWGSCKGRVDNNSARQGHVELLCFSLHEIWIKMPSGCRGRCNRGRGRCHRVVVNEVAVAAEEVGCVVQVVVAIVVVSWA